MKLNKKFTLTLFAKLREGSLALLKKKENLFFGSKPITLTDCIIFIMKVILEKFRFHLKIFQARKRFLLHNMFKLCYSFSWIMFNSYLKRAKPH